VKKETVNKYIFLLLAFSFSAINGQEKYIYYSDFASNTLKDHSITLPEFFKRVSETKAVGIIKGYGISINSQIDIKNVNDLNIRIENTVFNSSQRFDGFFLNFENCKNITIDGFNAVLSNPSFQAYQEKEYSRIFNGGILFKGCENIVLKHSDFENLYTRAVQITESFGKISISKNRFKSRKQKQSYLSEHFVVGSSPNAEISIFENDFENEEYTDPDFGICAISGYGLGKNGGSIEVYNNRISFAGRNNKGKHRLYAVDFYDDCDNITIKGNKLDNITWGAIRFNGTARNAIIEDNDIHVIVADDTGVITSSTTERNAEFNSIIIRNN
jgi:hypothetical protein